MSETSINTDLTVENRSSLGAMFWIGFYTFLLNIVTLTLFRFWGRTHFRRRLWADTHVGGEPLEYTGSGLELFIGFLIAMVVLFVPYVGAIVSAQFFLPPVAAALMITVLYIGFFILIGIALFLARRYHLSRTRYRGIRFAQTGSAVGYGFATFGYGLLTAITLGWFGPAMRIRLSRRIWNGAWFGSEQFAFVDTEDALKEPVYPSFAVAWIGGVIGYIAWIAAFAGLSGGFEELATGAPDVRFILMLYATLIPFGLFIGLIVAWHETVMIRRIIKSLQVGGVSFSSRLSTFDFIELTITNTLLIIFTLGVGVMPAQMRLWKRLANRMSLSGEIDFDAIRQSEEKAPSTGEGLADGLDLVSNF